MKEIKKKILDCLANENFNKELIGDKVKLQNRIDETDNPEELEELIEMLDQINELQLTKKQRNEN